VGRDNSHEEKTSRSILMIDDDVSLCALIAEFLEDEDFRVSAAYDGPTGLAAAFKGKHDLILLDVMLPGLNGLRILERLREAKSIPVIMLTAHNTEQDRITGLNSGADDYIAKPFEPFELLARIRAILRRQGHFRNPSASLAEGEIVLNARTRQVRKGKYVVGLTSMEFDILEILMRSAGRVVSRDELTAVLHNRDAHYSERAIDLHISHIRRKLEDTDRPLIQTVWGIGYMFAAIDENGNTA
jgi:two-component system response regulator CpxR